MHYSYEYIILSLKNEIVMIHQVVVVSYQSKSRPNLSHCLEGSHNLFSLLPIHMLVSVGHLMKTIIVMLFMWYEHDVSDVVPLFQATSSSSR